MPEQPNETAYRINHTPEGWTVEGYGLLWDGFYPTWMEACESILEVEQVLNTVREINKDK